RRIISSEEETRADVDPVTNNTTRKSDLPPLARPALDKDNMPLPHRVNEIDLEGTRVTPAAYEPTTDRKLAAARTRISQPPVTTTLSPSFFDTLRARFAAIKWRGNLGCFLRGVITMAFIGVVVALCSGSYLLLQYYSIARTLPDINDLQNRASQFETTRILDRNGQLLYEILDPTAGRRTYIPLDQISPNLVAATIATEDKLFYSHPGFDFWAVVRALWQNYRTGGQGGGASTITQQLARALLLSPEERAQRTYQRKAREIILAAEITRRYTKDQILELYLNEIYYGNLAYGIEAAAETYFGKNAKDLTVAEASFLAGLPQSPAVYDIYTNQEVTLIRQQQVLVLMFELSQAQNCIRVSNSDSPVCVDPMVATEAANAMKAYPFRPPSFDARYPHWVNFVRGQLEELYDSQTIYRSGFTVYTTLDPTLQDEAQRLVTEQIAQMVDKNAHNGALVALKPSTGEILAMVGSPDFYNDAISGQINMADSPTRQPGSSIKPVNYVAAFEKGWTPSTLIWDVPSKFPPSGDPNDTREPYEPVNYDGKFHGPVTVRVALANSFNVPAVKTLDFVGIYDDPNTPQKDGMIGMAERLGITSFTRNDYGLSLTLGGGDVSLLELTSAYSVFANAGQRVPPVAILKITDFAGNVVYEYQPQPEQVIRAEHAYLISSILSDNSARSWMFGTNSLLNLSFQVAAKTGTTNDFRDNWTLGYTPDLVTGVWVGNADYTPMVNTTGLSGAAPIWSQFMEYAVLYVTGGNPSPFVRPLGIMDRIVCSLSGTEPSPWCKGGQYTEVFVSDQPPLPPGQDLIRNIKLDLWTGLEASEQCKGPSENVEVLNVTDKWAREWFETGQGRDWLEQHGLPRNPYYAPERECTSGDPQAVIEFGFSDGQVISSPQLNITGTAYADGAFKSWRLEYGNGQDPGSWALLTQSEVPVRNGSLYNWDLSSLSNGTITLKLTVIGDRTEVEERIHLTVGLPTATPAPATPTVTAFPTEIPPTEIPPTETPTLTPFPSDTPKPTETPTP
ncbi:MAG: transglycosylase domain-containing protein, partial [Chloroflexota bacterium]